MRIPFVKTASGFKTPLMPGYIFITRKALANIMKKIAAYESIRNLLQNATDTIVKTLGDQPVNPKMPGMNTWRSTLQEALNMFGRTQDKNPQVVQQALKDIIGRFKFELAQGVKNYPQQAQVFQQAASLVTQAETNLASGQEGLMGKGGTPQEAKQVGQQVPQQTPSTFTQPVQAPVQAPVAAMRNWVNRNCKFAKKYAQSTPLAIGTEIMEMIQQVSSLNNISHRLAPEGTHWFIQKRWTGLLQKIAREISTDNPNPNVIKGSFSLLQSLAEDIVKLYEEAPEQQKNSIMQVAEKVQNAASKIETMPKPASVQERSTPQEAKQIGQPSKTPSTSTQPVQAPVQAPVAAMGSWVNKNCKFAKK